MKGLIICQFHRKNFIVNNGLSQCKNEVFPLELAHRLLFSSLCTSTTSRIVPPPLYCWICILIFAGDLSKYYFSTQVTFGASKSLHASRNISCFASRAVIKYQSSRTRSSSLERSWEML